ncbi:hypothetical protein SPONN_2255 [uncultured Candidatus Thioglobus sp.]|nr:hypothetical protein SPONN_2255 [uncultured Candidatus Thioglobus sp.]
MFIKNEKKDISVRIRVARLKANMSSIKVSKKMHLSDSMCSQWERGISNPSTAHLVRLAEVLQVSFEWLATGDIIENNQTKTKYQNQDIIISELIQKFDAEQKDRLIDFLYVVK